MLKIALMESSHKNRAAVNCPLGKAWGRSWEEEVKGQNNDARFQDHAGKPRARMDAEIAGDVGVRRFISTSAAGPVSVGREPTRHPPTRTPASQ